VKVHEVIELWFEVMSGVGIGVLDRVSVPLWEWEVLVVFLSHLFALHFRNRETYFNYV